MFKLPCSYEDIKTLHVNTLPNRAYFIPYGSRETALEGVRENSERFTLLNGEWKFGYYDSVLDLPDDVFAACAAPIPTTLSFELTSSICSEVDFIVINGGYNTPDAVLNPILLGILVQFSNR